MEYVLYKTNLSNRHYFGKALMKGKENLIHSKIMRAL